MSGDSTVALDRIREDLTLPYVALQRNGEVIASSGVPLPSEGYDVQLVLGLRPGDLRLPRPTCTSSNASPR
ncbi:MAG: hypothetical protein QG597_2892 [Actinomycetota bacterium]|nr:hypothetical protein [Actinomycetota bacterium]